MEDILLPDSAISSGFRLVTASLQTRINFIN
jgi:hypothetical protein